MKKIVTAALVIGALFAGTSAALADGTPSGQSTPVLQCRHCAGQ
ncbi:hypothetical protein Lesp02_63030 [Lentzea sp. NBRC 105346]|nr:hypothetical protein [Lentzea sp. NBRC 105346]GLZ34116.1 hypothetical protein Lesp02_63030 [Lentzea sp. NBRC 105346]